MPARPLTPEQKADADRLREIFFDHKVLLGLTQEQLAEHCAWETQSAVQQYLSGIIPLNTNALIKFCLALDVHPARISPTLAEPLEKIAELMQRCGKPEQRG